MVVRAGLAENKELRKKAERLAAVEAEKEMLEKLLDGLVLERDTSKKDLAEADKAIAAQGIRSGRSVCGICARLAQ